MCGKLSKNVATLFENQRCQKARLHESKDLAACSSVAVALGKLKLPRLEPAHGLHLLETPDVKKKKARRYGFTKNDTKMGSQNLKKFLTAKHMNMT